MLVAQVQTEMNNFYIFVWSSEGLYVISRFLELSWVSGRSTEVMGSYVVAPTVWNQLILLVRQASTPGRFKFLIHLLSFDTMQVDILSLILILLILFGHVFFSFNFVEKQKRKANFSVKVHKNTSNNLSCSMSLSSPINLSAQSKLTSCYLKMFYKTGELLSEWTVWTVFVCSSLNYGSCYCVL